MLENLIPPLRPILRSLTRSPGFTLFVILTLGLGIGSNTAVFSVADAFLFKPLPFPDAGRLVMLHERAPGDTTVPSLVSAADFLDFASRSTSYKQIAAYQQVDFNLSETGDPETVYSAVVTPNFFDTLRIKPMLGRTFAPGDDVPGKNQVVVLGYGLWQRRFAADPSVVGRQIKLNGSTYSVIGVMAKSVRFPVGGELWTPLAPTLRDKANRDWHSLRVVARLKNDISVSQARAELEAISSLLASSYPQTNRGWGVFVQPLHRYVTGEFNSQYSVLLLGAVFFVLLIACANVMGLQFARMSGRQKELAVRVALGASRWRIAQEIIAENLVLSLAGGLASLLFSGWSLDAIVSNMPSDVARYIAGWDNIQLDSRALVFTLAAAIFAGVLSGLVPALRTRAGVNDALKEGGRGTSFGRARLRSRGVLVVGQVAAAMVLLAGAGLMLKGSRSLLRVNQNLRPNSILTMQMALSDQHYGTASQRVSFYDRMLQRLAALPGVEDATIVSNPPYGSNQTMLPYTVEGERVSNASEQKSAAIQVVSPNYLQAFGIPLIRGRALRDSDRANAPGVVLVSENFVRRNWPGADAIGHRIRFDPKGDWLTVVGVVKDVRYNPWSTEIPPAIYQPYQQAPLYYTYIALRTKGDPLSLAAPARRVLAAIDIDRPLWEIKTLQRVIANEIIGLSYVAVMLTVLGAIALALSAVGIYGLMAYAVTERTHELGIRMALGADRSDVLRMIFERGLLLTFCGLAIGLAVSIPLARLLSSLIYGVSATDMATFGGTAVLLAAVALLACYVPARRAMSVDPIVALRQE